MSGRLSRAIRMSPLAVARRLVEIGTRVTADFSARRADARHGTYGDDGPDTLHSFLNGVAPPEPVQHMSRAAELFCSHHFDLLGSGWVNVHHGMRCRGLEGIAFPPVEAGDCGGVNASNRKESAAIRALIPPEYKMIDWQIDFRSGYRWDQHTWYRDIEIGSVRGADVKLPWELSRLQHLPQLAFEFGRTSNESLVAEVRNQLLDWIAANPPRYGVNWNSTMDVAIRAANMLVAYDLAQAYGALFDEPFKQIFRRSIREHALHIVGNLEWTETLRANHYLANIAGLAFCAAYLPQSAETDSWLDFAAGELESAVGEQFYDEGSNFEASTCYHRLSAEMVAYTLAVLDRSCLRLPGTWNFPALLIARIDGMRQFTRAATKPNGCIWQVGDNDSGRFLKLSPAYAGDARAPSEQFLDHSHLESAVGALFGEKSSSHMDAIVIERLLHAPFVVSPRAHEGGSEDPATVLPDGPPTDKRVFALDVAESPYRRTVQRFPRFGLYVYRNGEQFVGIRCGPIGQNGIGGHAHNDQLSLEVQDEGRDLFADPGTFVYTPLPERRNEYRAGAAHFAPRAAGEDQAQLNVGLFRLGNPWEARCIESNPERFIGQISSRGRVITRTVTFAPSQIIITDESWGCMLEHDHNARALRFSPGYGLLAPRVSVAG